MSYIKKIHATIDGKEVEVDPGTTILKAAESVGIKIPTLCYLKFMTPEASCRMCMVEIVGMPKLVTACSFPIADGNEILTKSERVIKARRGVLDLMLSNHPNHCFDCAGNGDCEFQSLCYEYGVKRLLTKVRWSKNRSMIPTHILHMTRTSASSAIGASIPVNIW